MISCDAAVEYRPASGFPGYRVGSDGSVWSCWIRRGKGYGRGIARVLSDKWWPMKLAADTAGYLVVSLCREKKVRVVKVHHLVLLAFIGPRPVGAHGCHNDGNPKNNAIGNLRWDTPSGNNADKKKHGTDQIGERHPLSKLSKDQVLTIKQRLAQGDSCVAISKAFGVAAATISTIKNGRTWGWLKLPTHWKEAERAE